MNRIKRIVEKAKQCQSYTIRNEINSHDKVMNWIEDNQKYQHQINIVSR